MRNGKYKLLILVLQKNCLLQTGLKIQIYLI